jgi:hypothetical protein
MMENKVKVFYAQPKKAWGVTEYCDGDSWTEWFVREDNAKQVAAERAEQIDGKLEIVD